MVKRVMLLEDCYSTEVEVMFGVGLDEIQEQIKHNLVALPSLFARVVKPSSRT